MAFSITQLKYFSDMILKELGIVYTAENYFQLERRLVDVCKSLGLPDEESLFSLAQKGFSGVSRQLFFDVATNNETSFFRDPKAFHAIEHQMIPAIRAANSGLKVIRVWCAASSFGQEPYSLAMLFSEMTSKDPSMPRFEIVATDISETALNRAKEGRYSQLEVQRGLPALLMVKYFTKGQDDFWTIKPEIRIGVQFKKQNLLESFAALGDFELILSRNVLIYQTDAGKKEVINQMSKRLTPKSFLLLGAAESLLGLSEKFEQICKEGAVFFRLK